jgi:hypothetical protein
LYWDAVVDEARLYEEDGSLIRIVGAQGDGPGEYRGVRALIRVDDGRLVTVDRRGRVLVWDASGESLVNQFTSGLSRVVGAASYEGSELMVYTSPQFADPCGKLAPSVHVMDIDREEVTASGFTPTLNPTLVTAVSTVEPPGPRRMGDSLVRSRSGA